jgi:hypothetical protein
MSKTFRMKLPNDFENLSTEEKVKVLDTEIDQGKAVFQDMVDKLFAKHAELVNKVNYRNYWLSQITPKLPKKEKI